MERLVEVLARVVSEPMLGMLEPETILVQSKGMERWLSNQLCERLGVFANARFPFPRTFIEEVFDVVVPCAEDSRERYKREVLTFGTLEVLETLLADPAFGALNSYLGDDTSGIKRFQLAGQIAHVFDQYLVYRPRMILNWEKGSGSDWQAKLWRALRAHLAGEHFPLRAERFFKQWSPLLVSPTALPKRVCLVGISSLPPIYLKILNQVSERVSVHLFLLSPSAEYFAQIRSLREEVHARRKTSSIDVDDAELEALQGNPLLASFGKTGRHFQLCLERDTLYRESDIDLFELAPEPTLLGLLQHDIVKMLDHGLRGSLRHEVTKQDRSLHIISCHSPFREVEVLRDQLLGLLEDDPSLGPGDMLVMSPNIDVYAPLIDAVFGVDRRDPLFIPYRVADRTERSSNLCAKALLAVLDVVAGRMTSSAVLDLLQLAPIHRRFGIDPSEFNQLQTYVHDAGIRWGLDAGHRALHGQPPGAENTWRFGLDRLLLGVALPASADELFMGALPVDDVEGGSAHLLGNLAELLETLNWAASEARGQRPVADWVRFLCELQARTIEADDSEIWQQRATLDVIFELGRNAGQGRFEGATELLPLVEQMTARFESERVSHQFLAGGITFCAMLPMRSIPFRVVVLLGMNDGEFPRVERKLSFDLTQQAAQVGDRSLKDEDRYLFLEALLSARQCFWVSYVGRNVQDNAVLPPSPVVSELIEYIDNAFRSQGERLDLVVEHPLQPFSPRYFDSALDPRLFSFSEAEALGAEALNQRRAQAPPFFSQPLAPLEQARELELDHLIRFLQNPARSFLQDRLGIFLNDDPKLVEDREPIELGPFERYQLGAALLERAMSDEVSSELEGIIRASGVLPHGTPGSVTYRDVWSEVEHIAAHASPWLDPEPQKPLFCQIPFGELQLAGQLRRVFSKAQVFWQYARVKPKNELALWLHHLLLHAAGFSRVSILVGRALEESRPDTAVCMFDPLSRDEAITLLGHLVKLYQLGHQQPLPLFPAASKVFVAELAKGEGQADLSRALTRARDAFAPPFASAGSESTDPYIARVFAGRDPFAEAETAQVLGFRNVSQQVFVPMLRFRRREGTP